MNTLILIAFFLGIDPAPPRVFVQAEPTGCFYIKAVPASKNQKGKTELYKVREGKDILEFTYQWYDLHILLGTLSDEFIVCRYDYDRRNTGVLLTFYTKTNVVKTLPSSVINLASFSTNSSVQMIRRTHGFAYPDDRSIRFACDTADGIHIEVNPLTGDVVSFKDRLILYLNSAEHKSAIKWQAEGATPGEERAVFLGSWHRMMSARTKALFHPFQILPHRYAFALFEVRFRNIPDVPGELEETPTMQVLAKKASDGFWEVVEQRPVAHLLPECHLLR